MSNANLKIGNIVNVAGIEWIILDKSEGNHYFFQNYVLCLSKDLLYSMQLSKDSADYSKSDIRLKLNNELLPKLKDTIGVENILDTEIGLVSSDGSTNYGIVTDKVGLLTEEIYFKYKNTIKQYPVDDWWWLATQWKSDSRFVRCVDFDGALSGGFCNGGFGVRPFCRFNPKIFNLNLKDDDNDKSKV